MEFVDSQHKSTLRPLSTNHTAVSDIRWSNLYLILLLPMQEDRSHPRILTVIELSTVVK